jgi:hypothetical protein
MFREVRLADWHILFKINGVIGSQVVDMSCDGTASFDSSALPW